MQIDTLCEHAETVKGLILNELAADSNKNFRQFSIDQCSGGAGSLHKYTNSENVTFADVRLFDRTHGSSTPAQVIESKKETWIRQ